MDWMHRLKGRNCVLLCSLQRPGVHNFSFQFSSLMSRLCFPLFSSISHILSVSETFEDWLWYYQLALETSHQHARSLTFSIPRARQNRLDLRQKTWEHWGGWVPGVWCQTCQLEPTPKSASHPNKWRQPLLRVPKSMEHGKVNMQSATSSYKLEEVVYEQLGEWCRRRGSWEPHFTCYHLDVQCLKWTGDPSRLYSLPSLWALVIDTSKLNGWMDRVHPPRCIQTKK